MTQAADDDRASMLWHEERAGGRGGAPREGGRRDDGPFPCQSDITVGPFRASVAIGTGEATIVYAPPRSTEGSWVSDEGKWEYLVDSHGEVLTKRPKLSDLERESKNLERASKRAHVALRRYCVANQLLKMLTLTYAQTVLEHKVVKDDVNALFVRWRSLKGGKSFPYAYVLEFHPGGHGLHVHTAVPLHFIDKFWLEETWGHGIVHYRDPKPLRHGDTRERARNLSRYLSKYVSKDLGNIHEKNAHRYEVAQGFGVEVERQAFHTLVEANHWLSKFRDESFVQVWESSKDQDWEGPPVWVFRSPGEIGRR